AGEEGGGEDREGRREEAGPPAGPGQGQAAGAAAAAPGRRRLTRPPAELQGEAERGSARAARGGSRAGVGPGRAARAARGLVRRARSARAAVGPPDEFDPAPGGAYKQRHARSPRPVPASRRLPLAPRGRG